VTLRELITQVLKKAGHAMEAEELAAAVNKTGKRWKDGSRVSQQDVLDRADKYPGIFRREGTLVALRDDATLPQAPGGIAEVFNSVNRWRNFPGYRMESRVELFFSLYLPGLLTQHFGTPVSDTMIPLLPLQREKGSELLETVEFTLMASDLSQVWLVDLKADHRTRREYRDTFLRTTVRAGLRPILRGIVDLAQLADPVTAPRWYYLLHALGSAGLLRLPEVLQSRMEVARSSEFVANWRVLFAQVELEDVDPDVHLVYVQPEQPEDPEGVECIDFNQVMAYVQHFNDDLSRLLMKSLALWKKREGAISPYDERLDLQEPRPEIA
jgi:hypothetical protein